MKKVLYIGNYLDGTGWGNMAAENILAMEEAGIDVVPRRITYSRDIIPNQKLQALESKSLKGCEICIQHCLPSDYYKSKDMKCIGLLHYETEDLTSSFWPYHTKQMDEIWLSQACKTKIANSLNKNVFSYVPSIDIETIKKIRNRPTVSIKELREGYNFCFFGEFIYRKNVQALLKAFHLEFDKYENVNLFVKLSGKTNPEETLNRFYSLNNQICKDMNIARPKQIHALAGNMAYSEYISMLNQCHCMVIPSYGEDPCIPAMEAISMGLSLIRTEGAGICEDIEDCENSGIESVSSHCVPCEKNDYSIDNLYSGKSQWREININSLRNKMRKMYETKSGKDRVCFYDFSRKRSGERFKELLCKKII